MATEAQNAVAEQANLHLIGVFLLLLLSGAPTLFLFITWVLMEGWIRILYPCFCRHDDCFAQA
jgi:hypothetical protein